MKDIEEKVKENSELKKNVDENFEKLILKVIENTESAHGSQ